MQTQHLIEELYSCEARCKQSNEDCLLDSENETLKRCMILTQECADICRITANSFEMGSENAERFLILCSDICEECARECEKHSYNHCQECAHVCFKCAEMCLIFQQTPKEKY